MNDNTNPKDNKNLKHEGDNEKNSGHSDDNKNLEDNSTQRGLTGESDEDEDVTGDLAGNAAGNLDE